MLSISRSERQVGVLNRRDAVIADLNGALVSEVIFVEVRTPVDARVVGLPITIELSACDSDESERPSESRMGLVS